MPSPVGVPKAELHVHVEGTLEPELMFVLARRNDVALPYTSVDEVRAAYRFTDLQSFLDIYYRACDVLRTEQDFYDLGLAYLAQGLESRCPPRGDLLRPPDPHRPRHPRSARSSPDWPAPSTTAPLLASDAQLILCFLRHLPEDDAMATLHDALAFRDRFVGVGLDSSERGYPPAGFERVFAAGPREGLHAVAHAGEEGPPEYIWPGARPPRRRADRPRRALPRGRRARRRASPASRCR